MISLNHSLYFSVYLLFSLFSNPSQGNDFIAIGSCGDTQSKNYRNIAEVQGTLAESGNVKSWPSPFIDQWVVVEGIVILDKTKEYQGFWLQQYDKKRIINTASRGIFIYHAKANIKRGQRLRVLAQVAEYHGLTELKRVKALTICANNRPIPKASSLTLPVKSMAELEALEGMRVIIKQPLLVSDLFGSGYGLGSNGQFAISSRLHMQPTERYSAKYIRSKKVWSLDKKLDYLLVDDGHAARFPEFIPFPNSKGFSANNPIRIGDRINQISAIVHSYNESYILIPEPQTGDSNIGIGIEINSQPRPKHPRISESANIVIASMNLENYFNGNRISFNNRDVGFPTPRGARSYSGFLMQTQKLVSALTAMNADVIALMELENDGYGEHSAIADLTRALNKKLNLSQCYKYIIPDRKKLGEGAISVGILYRSQKVKPLATVAVLDSSSSIKYKDEYGKSRALFNDGYNRPSLLQKFSSAKQSFYSISKSFYVAVNHFKSKGRACKTEVKDDLQGHCNLERTNAALALVDFISRKTEKGAPVLIMGDLNSYSKEDPLLVLEEAGFKNLNAIPHINFGEKSFFSYSYQGYLGNLDHVLANGAMLPFVRSIDSWHINSVEDSLLDYHTESNGQNYPSIDHYAEPDAYRSSDHDPLVIGIKF
jgi:predicted extracellular nuclease